MIPQSNPGAAYRALRVEIDAAIQRVLDSGWYVLGPEVEAFETALAESLGVAHAVGVASGTDALELALRGCGIGPGGLVFTVSHTAVATVAAIERAGAQAVLVDIDPATYTMDPDGLQATVGAHEIDGRPAAVVPVHLYGQPAEMPAICAIAAQYGLRVVEDCAQAQGADYAGRLVGTWGDAAAFSFYPTKNLGALGDAGAVVTADAEIAQRVRDLRQYGWRERLISHEAGLNSRMDSLQAAILRVKLDRLDAGNKRRRAIAAAYRNGLGDTGVGLPVCGAEVGHVYHQFVIRAPQRDQLRERLHRLGVGTLVHYPMPVNQQPAYAGRLSHGPLPQSERASAEVLSLPIYPELSDADVRTVIAAVQTACTCDEV